MRNESILYSVIGLLVGVMLTVFVVRGTVNTNSGLRSMMGVRTTQNATFSSDESMGMDAMTAGLTGKTGDDFDKSFLSEMIVHHQGAIEMAGLARANAKHPELKTLADSIISAQSSEISRMKQWQLNWGYGTSDNSMGGMHMGN